MSLKHSVVISVLGSLGSIAVLSGCAPQTEKPEPVATALPTVLLRSSHMAAKAQQRVSEVLYVQSHPAVIAVAPSHALAVDDRFNFHWEGSLRAVGENLATAMGWNFVQHGPQPSVMPQIYVDQHNADVRWMIQAINKQAMPTAMLQVNQDQRSIILTVPNKAEISAWEHPKAKCAKKNSVPTKAVKKVITTSHAPVWEAKAMGPQTVALTLKNGHLSPIKMFPQGHNIPLQAALTQHWKLVIPAHPTVQEKAIAEQWRKAGGLLLRL
jgi:hypothetical protein